MKWEWKLEVGSGKAKERGRRERERDRACKEIGRKERNRGSETLLEIIYKSLYLACLSTYLLAYLRDI